MTSETTQVITQCYLMAALHKLIALEVTGTRLAFQFSEFLHKTSSGEAYPNRLEQLLKYQLGVWRAIKEF